MPATTSKGFKPAVPQAFQEPWVVRHWQQLLIALGALLAGGVLAVVVVTRLNKAVDQAWEQLSYASSQAAQGQRENAVATLDALLAARRTGAPAVQALMMKADLLSALGKKAEALAAAQEARRQAVSPEYRALASAALAHAQEDAGHPDEAAAEYGRLIKEFPDHFLVARAYAQVGRLESSRGRTAEARAAHEKLVTLYPSTVWARDAKAALEELKK